MRIFAIDQSYTSSGLVVLVNENMIHCEKFTTDKEKDTFERAWEVASRIREVASEYKPDVVALEGLAFAKNGNATRDLAGLQHTIVTLIKYVDGYEVVVISPNTVKKTATGKGNAKKDQMVEALPPNIRSEFDALGVKKTTGLQDLSDAFWIGKTLFNQRC